MFEYDSPHFVQHEVFQKTNFSGIKRLLFLTCDWRWIDTLFTVIEDSACDSKADFGILVNIVSLPQAWTKPRNDTLTAAKVLQIISWERKGNERKRKGNEG